MILTLRGRADIIRLFSRCTIMPESAEELTAKCESYAESRAPEAEAIWIRQTHRWPASENDTCEMRENPELAAFEKKEFLPTVYNTDTENSEIHFLYHREFNAIMRLFRTTLHHGADTERLRSGDEQRCWKAYREEWEDESKENRCGRNCRFYYFRFAGRM